MEGVLQMESDHKRRTWGIPLLLAVIVAGAFLFWWRGGLDKVIAANSQGKAKAEALVAAYAKHVGAHDRLHQTLDENNDRSFGDFGFHYFPEQDVLQARMYIVKSDVRDRPDTAIYAAKVDAGLNDPKIGGMYDRGGGYFHEDEKQQILFLVKDYKVSAISPSEFIRDVDNLSAISGIWVTSWFKHAARQSYGKEPPPSHFVDREHNPYGTH